LRRPTADIDFASIQVLNNATSERKLVTEIAANALPGELDGGLSPSNTCLPR
jgi:hypothetical protein